MGQDDGRVRCEIEDMILLEKKKKDFPGLNRMYPGRQRVDYDYYNSQPAQDIRY